MKRLTPWMMAASIAVVLTGCGNSSIDSMREWMREETSRPRPNIKPLPEPSPYKAVDYVAPAGVEPFSVARLVQAINAANANSPTSAIYRSVVEGHRKQPLEAYPLDSMAYVGMLTKDGRPVALVKVDNLLYQVRTGDFMGQNYGRVMSINEGQLALREVAQDATGEWVERNTTLNLQEGSK